MGVWPAELGYRMPPEWAPHQAVWLSWPHRSATWPGGVGPAERALVPAVAALAAGELVRINVLGAEHEAHVRGLLDGHVSAGRVRFHQLPTNDAWCRDHGAIFVTRPPAMGDPLLALNFGYNAWGGKYPPFDLDDRVPAAMAAALDVPCRDGGMILEGGSIDVNGAGTLLTTRSCLLNPNRNPGMDRAVIEGHLRGLLGVTQIVWLGDGIVGDDTDGHVDDITRFVSERTVVTVVEPDRTDENHEALAANLEYLHQVRLPDGQPLRVVELPMPGPVFWQGERLPASYANFLIGNQVVLMPAFQDPQDEVAAQILAAEFPGRRIVPLDCRAIVQGLGAIHCLSQQVPVPGAGW
jgi:agmatine deiminase